MNKNQDVLIAVYRTEKNLIFLGKEINHDKISYYIKYVYEQYTIRYDNEKEAKNEFLKCIENLLKGDNNE